MGDVRKMANWLITDLDLKVAGRCFILLSLGGMLGLLLDAAPKGFYWFAFCAMLFIGILVWIKLKKVED